MSAKERLTRLRALQAMATQLQVALIEECDLTRKQVDAIEASIQEGEERCQAMNTGSWDGKQPDLWKPKGGKIWRRPNDKDIGKMVRVTMTLGRDPEILPEAELIGFTQPFGDVITKSTTGKGVCWAYAWIEAGKTDVVDTDGKGHISIQIDGLDLSSHLKRGLVGAWKPAPTNKLEQPDQLIDVVAKPEPGTVAKKPWKPMIGSWVVLPGGKPGRVVAKDTHAGQAMYSIEGKNTKFTAGVLKPWEPKQGDKVLTATPRRVHEVQSVDRNSKIVFLVGHAVGFEIGQLRPYIAPEPQYRDPTNEDFGKKVEVRDEELHDWMEADFVAVLPPGDFRFAVDDGYGVRTCWRFARIKVEG